MEKRHLYLATISLCVFLFGADASLGTFAHGRGPSPVIEAGRSSVFNYIYGLFSRDKAPAAAGPSPNSIGDERRPKQTPAASQLGDTADAWLIPFDKARQFSRYPPCTTVMNKHATQMAIMVPVKTREEWLSFRNNPPPGITFHSCYCGRLLSEGQIYAAVTEFLGYDPTIRAIPQYPEPGYRPPYSARAPTVQHICEVIGCRGVTSIRGRRFDDPDDDAILHWVGTDWRKFPARFDNWKIENRFPALNCTE